MAESEVRFKNERLEKIFTPAAIERVRRVDESVRKGKLSFDDVKVLALNESQLEVSNQAKDLAVVVSKKHYGQEVIDPSTELGVLPFQYVVTYVDFEEHLGVDVRGLRSQYNKTKWREVLRPYYFNEPPEKIPFHTCMLGCVCNVLNQKIKALEEELNPEGRTNKITSAIKMNRVPLALFRPGELENVTRDSQISVLEFFGRFDATRQLASNSRLVIEDSFLAIPNFFKILHLLEPIRETSSKFMLERIK